MFTRLLTLVALFLVMWFWWRSRAAAELARKLAMQRCQQLDLQFLDDTVAMNRIWLGRSLNGRVHICRSYTFDFCTNGTDRHEGTIKLFGTEVQRVELPPYPEP